MLGHAEIDAAMRLVHVVFLERALVEKDVETFARGQLALGVLGVDAPLAAAETGFRAALFELIENILHVNSSGGPAGPIAILTRR